MLKDILSISGQPGLYKLVSNTKNGIIVENLETKKRMPAYASAKVSALEDISIYTEDGEDKPLGDVMKSIREELKGEAALSPKSDAKEIKEFFEIVMPDYDKERVYVSDIKKVLQWYNTIHKLDLLNVLDQEDSKEETTEDKKTNEEGKNE